MRSVGWLKCLYVFIWDSPDSSALSLQIETRDTRVSASYQPSELLSNTLSCGPQFRFKPPVRGWTADLTSTHVHIAPCSSFYHKQKDRFQICLFRFLVWKFYTVTMKNTKWPQRDTKHETPNDQSETNNHKDQPTANYPKMTKKQNKHSACASVYVEAKTETNTLFTVCFFNSDSFRCEKERFVCLCDSLTP